MFYIEMPLKKGNYFVKIPSYINSYGQLTLKISSAEYQNHQEHTNRSSAHIHIHRVWDGYPRHFFLEAFHPFTDYFLPFLLSYVLNLM